MRAGFYNTGDGNTYESTRRFMNRVDLYGVTEMLSRDTWHNRLKNDTGFRGYKGKGREDEDQVQIFWNPKRIQMLEPVSELLVPERFVGDGPGPSRSNNKYAVGGLFEDNRSKRNFWAFVGHNLSGRDDSPQRVDASNDFIKEVIKLYRECTKGSGADSFLFMVDMNIGHRKPPLEPMFKAGLTNNHILLGHRPTKGHDWSPDQMWIPNPNRDRLDPPKITFTRHGTEKGESDHKFLWCDVAFRQGRED